MLLSNWVILCVCVYPGQTKVINEAISGLGHGCNKESWAAAEDGRQKTGLHLPSATSV